MANSSNINNNFKINTMNLISKGIRFFQISNEETVVIKNEPIKLFLQNMAIAKKILTAKAFNKLKSDLQAYNLLVDNYLHYLSSHMDKIKFEEYEKHPVKYKKTSTTCRSLF
jgi:hypothetical protein